MTEHDEPTKDDLIAEAERKGMATSGTKAELQRRLDRTEGKWDYIPDASAVGDDLEDQLDAAEAQAQAQGKNWI